MRFEFYNQDPLQFVGRLSKKFATHNIFNTIQIQELKWPNKMHRLYNTEKRHSIELHMQQRVFKCFFANLCQTTVN